MGNSNSSGNNSSGKGIWYKIFILLYTMFVLACSIIFFDYAKNTQTNCQNTGGIPSNDVFNTSIALLIVASIYSLIALFMINH